MLVQLTLQITKTSEADEKVNFQTSCLLKDSQKKYSIIQNCNHSTEDFRNNRSLLELNKTGMTFLDAKANPFISPRDQSRALGYFEGNVFADFLYQHYVNIHDWYMFSYLDNADDYPDTLYQFMQENLDFMREMTYKYATISEYWRQVSYTVAALDAVYLGYSQAMQNQPEKQISMLEYYTYFAAGESLDLVEYLEPSSRGKQVALDIDDHCSGLVSIVGQDGIQLSQTAWFGMFAQTRVWKSFFYNFKSFNDQLDNTSATYSDLTIQQQFSSYPGFNYLSFDDWYSYSTGISALETTNNIYNSALYELNKPQCILTSVRAPVAGRSAKDPEDFATIVSKYNSGSYNNQWPVIDYKRYEAGEKENVLFVSEQCPGRVVSFDQTERLLRDLYFPSYNSPSSEALREIQGYNDMYATTGNTSYDYEHGPRANIFRRDAPTLSNIHEVQEEMRYNDYLHDEYSIEPSLPVDDQGQRDPSYAISSRYDLRIDSRKNCFGGFDSKTGMYNTTSKEYKGYFVSSPTHTNVTAFQFSTAEANGLYCPQYGLPDGPYVHEYVETDIVKGW